MNFRNRMSTFKVVLISVMLGFLALGQEADGGLVGIITPYLVAILTLLFIALPVEVILRKAFGASLFDLVR